MRIELGVGSGYLNLKFPPYAFLLIKILSYLRIRYFDTAENYANGKGEKLLGLTLPITSRVITKLSIDDVALMNQDLMRSNEVSTIEEAFTMRFTQSLHRLRREKCFALLLHSITPNDSHQAYIPILRELKQRKLVEKIGFSIDLPNQLPGDIGWADIVELPILLLPDLKPKLNQTVIVNGIFRNEDGKKILFEFLRRNPEIETIALTGSKRLIRILQFRKQLRSGSLLP